MQVALLYVATHHQVFEPLRANAFSQKTLSGSFLIKNKYLVTITRKERKEY